MIFEKLQNVDRRVIYTLLIVVLLVPMFKPLGIPLAVNATTQVVYDTIEALNPQEDVVLFVIDYSPGGSPDVHPQALAVAEHLRRRGIKTVMVAFVDAGLMFAEQILDEMIPKGWVYGTDVINLGYMSGMETGVKNFAENPLGSFVKCNHGLTVADQPIMQGIEHITDFAYIIDFQTGNPGYQEFLRQVQGPYGVKYAAGIVTVSVPNTMPFVASGQISGLLQGLRGAAEYEILLGAPGGGAAKMDAQSLGHLLIIAFIIVGNVSYFLTKKKPTR